VSLARRADEPGALARCVALVRSSRLALRPEDRLLRPTALLIDTVLRCVYGSPRRDDTAASTSSTSSTRTSNPSTHSRSMDACNQWALTVKARAGAASPASEPSSCCAHSRATQHGAALPPPPRTGRRRATTWSRCGSARASIYLPSSPTLNGCKRCSTCARTPSSSASRRRRRSCSTRRASTSTGPRRRSTRRSSAWQSACACFHRRRPRSRPSSVCSRA
jgi:hypothetical protein